MNVDEQTRALLELVEADRARRCAATLGEAHTRAAALRAQAHADARARMRQAFEEQRTLRRDRLAAAQARLATQRRLHEQQRTAALLRLAWARLPGELLALWQAPATRADWVAQVMSAAAVRLPRGPWRIVHAPDWPETERQAMAAAAVQSGAAGAPRFEPDDTVTAGLKVTAEGNVIDGTLAGLLADRADFEARLLRRLESSP